MTLRTFITKNPALAAVLPFCKPGDMVEINQPERPKFHGKRGRVTGIDGPNIVVAVELCVTASVPAQCVRVVK